MFLYVLLELLTMHVAIKIVNGKQNYEYIGL